jgi:hypothetical protein
MSAASPALVSAPTVRVDAGRPFVGHAFDYLLIGGGLSLIVALAVALGGRPQLAAFIQAHGTVLILLSNSAHFAASTVRLYTKRDTWRDLPFLTMGLPLVTLLVLTAAVAYPKPIGPHIWALYLTWSPYHYGAQAYGLALMYCYRSGGQWSDSEKRWLRVACLCPFLWVFVGGRGLGLDWLAPAGLLDTAVALSARKAIGSLLAAATFLLPILLLAWRRAAGRSPLPLISALILWSNGVWLISLAMAQAFVWATIFHGIQYLAIVCVFHVREKLREGGNTRPGWQHAAAFYLACLGLGYLLFQVWPLTYTLLGFGYAESMLLVIAAINLHHFIVDAFIWRLRRDPNYATLEPARS